jgi:antitoxin component of MazEF toxin-antitoxin module
MPYLNLVYQFNICLCTQSDILLTIRKDLLTALGAEEGDEIEFKVENGKLIGIPVVAVRVRTAVWTMPQHKCKSIETV